MTQFLDQSIQSCDDNLRWSIANKLINRILETCNINYLEELLMTIFKTKLQTSLNKDITLYKQQDYYNLVREKTHVLLMLEIFVRRLDATILRTTIN
jgi:hypothetical protein